jgi:putative ABC transporter-associated repeat protein
MRIRELHAALVGLLALGTVTAPGGGGWGLGPAAAAWAQDGGDPNLQQSLAPGQQIVHGKRVLAAGHVDMGPKFDNGSWRFLIHDDVAKADTGATSVWRYPAETVLHVRDEARLTVPEDPAYAFIGAKPGSPVWVIPQTQKPEVVWLGWNTQDPEVMKSIDRGVNLSLTGVQGPGIVTVYLLSGSFGAPQVLWDSRKAEAQPVWVDVNTHTHANWVFTQPGAYLLQLGAQADLVDGRQVSDTQLIRLAVGTATSPDDALAATWQGAAHVAGGASPGSAATGGQGTSDAARPSNGAPVPILIGVIAVLAVALIAGITGVVVRGNRVKRRVLASRSTREASIEDGGTTG